MTTRAPGTSGAMVRDLHLCERKVALDIHGDPSLRDPILGITRVPWRERLTHEDDVLGSLGLGAVYLRRLSRTGRETSTDPGGANSIEWYGRFIETGDTSPRARIVAYNLDDVIASQVALAELEDTGTVSAFRRPTK